MAIGYPPKTLLFDLGGVIVPWVGMEFLAEYNNITRMQVSDRFDSSETFQKFERGHAGHADFIDELGRLFDLPDTDVPTLWNSWVHAPYAGVLDALAVLKTQYTLGCLSNTNDLHWTYLNTMFSTDETFHYPLASHQIGEAKPDASCYTKSLNIMGVETSDVWFFEDTLANVEAARGVGIKTFHVDRSVGVLPTLRELGLIT